MTTTSYGVTIKSDRQVISDALALFQPEHGWTQGTYCRDADGVQLQPVVGSRGEWVRVHTVYVGAGGYRAHTEPGATPCSYCVQGAVRTAAGYWHFGESPAIHEQVDRLESLLLQLANAVAEPAWSSLDAFNDDARTTKADVVLTLKHAVAHLETEEQQ